MPDDATIAVTELTAEEQSVLRWRYTQLRRLGVERLDARLVAESDADLALVRRLVGAGCPPHLAVLIAL